MKNSVLSLLISTEPCNLKYFVVLENQTNLISDESGSEDNFTFLVGHLGIHGSENIYFLLISSDIWAIYHLYLIIQMRTFSS